MSGPGKGRYTTYVPVSSTRNDLLRKLFNANAPNNQGVFYGKLDQTDNSAAAAAAVVTATAPVKNGVGGLIPSDGHQVGDAQMFPTGVELGFGNSPDLPKDVSWKNPGDPANAYVPDITSPGPGKTNPLDKSVDPKITIADLKPNYIPGAPDTGTADPAKVSQTINAPIGKDLTMGKSSV